MNGMPMKQGQSCTGLNKMEWIRTDSNWSSRGWIGVGKFVSGRALFEIHARRVGSSGTRWLGTSTPSNPTTAPIQPE